MLTAGEALYRLFRNHAQAVQSAVDPMAAGERLLDHAERMGVLPKALKAASLCEFQPYPMTPLQQKINDWGVANYRKLTVVTSSTTRIADAVLDERSRCFGLTLAEPFTLAVEQQAYREAGRSMPLVSPYAEAERQEREWRDGRQKRPGAVYPV